MIYSAEERAMIWLSACSGLENRMRALLLRTERDPALLYKNFEEIITRVSENGKESVYKTGTLPQRERELDSLLGEMERKGQRAVVCFSEDYPEELKESSVTDPPLVLFCKGNLALLGRRKIGIVGSRVTPEWAAAQGRKVAEILSEQLTVVTGLAEGGDLCAVRGALGSGNLICVLPNGLDECYPAAHASVMEEVGKKGLLVTECPPHEKVHRGSFHARNRILAALARNVLVLSAGKKSGALITANFVLEGGGNVYAFPYNLGIAQGEGCNELIKNGAFLCTGAEDILLAYGLSAGSAPVESLTGTERRVLALLGEEEAVHAAIVAEKTGIPVYEAAATLSSLELKGLAVRAGGNRYSRI